MTFWSSFEARGLENHFHRIRLRGFDDRADIFENERIIPAFERADVDDHVDFLSAGANRFAGFEALLRSRPRRAENPRRRSLWWRSRAEARPPCRRTWSSRKRWRNGIVRASSQTRLISSSVASGFRRVWSILRGRSRHCLKDVRLKRTFAGSGRGGRRLLEQMLPGGPAGRLEAAAGRQRLVGSAARAPHPRSDRRGSRTRTTQSDLSPTAIAMWERQLGLKHRVRVV